MAPCTSTPFSPVGGPGPSPVGPMPEFPVSQGGWKQPQDGPAKASARQKILSLAPIGSGLGVGQTWLGWDVLSNWNCTSCMEAWACRGLTEGHRRLNGIAWWAACGPWIAFYVLVSGLKNSYIDALGYWELYLCLVREVLKGNFFLEWLNELCSN